jgi:hypothetical protein
MRAFADRGINNSTSHCPTKQSSRLVIPAADFCVRHQDMTSHKKVGDSGKAFGEQFKYDTLKRFPPWPQLIAYLLSLHDLRRLPRKHAEKIILPHEQKKA